MNDTILTKRVRSDVCIPSGTARSSIPCDTLTESDIHCQFSGLVGRRDSPIICEWIRVDVYGMDVCGRPQQT